MKTEKKTSDAQRKAVAKYDAENTRMFTLKMNNNTDSDIIQHLESQANRQGYLKDLIRADIEKDNSLTLKAYLAVMDNDISITIHQEGEYDGHYLYVSDIEEDLLNRTVIKVETGLPNKTDLRISIK